MRERCVFVTGATGYVGGRLAPALWGNAPFTIAEIGLTVLGEDLGDGLARSFLDLVIGIDCSTTAAKAVVWDRDGAAEEVDKPLAQLTAPIRPFLSYTAH